MPEIEEQNSIEFKCPAHFTEEHQIIMDIISEEKCRELEREIGPQPININPIIKYLRVKSVFVCTEIEGLDYKQTAEKLNMNYVTVHGIYNGHKMRNKAHAVPA